MQLRGYDEWLQSPYVNESDEDPEEVEFDPDAANDDREDRELDRDF